MDQMHSIINSRFQDYLIEQQIKDIQKFETDLNKNLNKKKKKKGKKKDSKQQKQQKGQESDTEQKLVKQKNKIQQNVSGGRNAIQQKQTKQKQQQQLKQQISSDASELKQVVISTQIQKQIQIVIPKECHENKNSSNYSSKIMQSSTKSESSGVKKYKKEKKQEQESKSIKVQQLKNNSQKKSPQVSKTSEQKSESYTDSTCKLQSSDHKKNQISQEKYEEQSHQQQRHTTKTKQYQQYYAHDKTSQMSQQSELSADYLSSKPKSKSLSKPSIVGVSMKKIDRKIQQESKKQKQLENIMGGALEQYAKNLIEESQKFQPTRKAAVDLIKEVLIHQQIKSKWQLIQYGSVDVGYALKQSDVDIVFRIEDSSVYSLLDMQIGLNSFPWILNCDYVKITDYTLLKVKVNLYEARKLSNRLLKKLDNCLVQHKNIWQYAEDFIVTLDISLSDLKGGEYSGIIRTNNLRFLFYQNQPLKKFLIILKDLLRRKRLNKPYHGGINSYVLTLMIYGIIKKKQFQLAKSTKVENQHVIKRKKDYLQALKSNLYIALCEVGNYLKEFIAFETIINPLEQKIQPKQVNHLNIVDPFSKKFIKTSAFRIDIVVHEFQAFRMLLDSLKQEIKCQELQNKKLKQQVSQLIVDYMNKLQPEPRMNKDNLLQDEQYDDKLLLLMKR